MLDLRASHQVPLGQDMGYGPAAGRGLQTSTPVRGTLNGRWDEGCLTCLAILGTFRTAEGFAVIKSELVDRISVQNPHLYRQDAEKIVNTIFSEITAAMARGDRVELRGFGVFLSGNPVSIQHQGYARLLSENTLQGTGTHLSNKRSASSNASSASPFDARRRRRITARSSRLLSASS